MAQAELQPLTLKLDKLINRIEAGEIKIPAFQRGFVWTQEQVINLLDSIHRNYPIGSILLWSSNDKLKSARNVAGFEIPDKPLEYPVNYVLDGQQRLSTIYGVFCTDRRQTDNDAYRVDPNIFEISYDFRNDQFDPAPADAKRAIMLSALFNTEKLFEAMEVLSPEDKKAAQRLYSTFSNYEIPVVEISKRTKDEVGTIFERINNTGTKLTTLDLMVAWTWSEDFHLQDEMNQLLETLDTKGFGDIPERIILQCLGAMLKQSTTTRTILTLDPQQVREQFPGLVKSLERTVDFLATHLKVSSTELLPHMQQIVGISYFFSRTDAPDATQMAAIEQWFWRTAFSRRYSAQTDDKMNEDLILFADIASNKAIDLKKYEYTVDAKGIIRQTLTKQNPLARAVLLLLARRAPMDLVTGTNIDTGLALSSFNRKEYHHIFPRAFLKGKGVATDRINSLANFCFLPAGSNKKISSKAPSDYMKTIVPNDKRKEILEANLLPLKSDIYEKDNYDEFLESRAQALLTFLDSLLI